MKHTQAGSTKARHAPHLDVPVLARGEEEVRVFDEARRHDRVRVCEETAVAVAKVQAP